MRAAAVLSAALALGGCLDPSPELQSADPARATLGEVLFTVARQGFAQSDCGDRRARHLDTRRDELIGALDAVLTDEVTGALPDTMRNGLLPLVDDGSLPALTETVAAALELLSDDTFDPERRALAALLDTSAVATTVETEHLLALVRALTRDPGLREAATGLAGLSLAHDGVDFAVNSLLDLWSGALDVASEPARCDGLDLGDPETTLLRTHGLPDLPSLGAPAWSVRRDDRGLPKVAVDPATNALYAPFVDRDGDGLADADADGFPLDATGQRIDIPVFDQLDAPRRDAAGRALAGDGQPIYRYFDAKRSGLGLAMQLLPDALTAGVHRDVFEVVDAALGAPVPCADRPSCEVYPGADHPIADLAYLVVEWARMPRASAFLVATAEIVRTDPRLAEDLLVALGRVLDAGTTGSAHELTVEEVADLATDLLPLVARIYETDNAAGTSTARLVLNAVDDMGRAAADYPERLSWIVNHRRLSKPAACDAAAPDLASSVPVDYDRPTFYSDEAGRFVDNRSALEQGLVLLSELDCGAHPRTDDRTLAAWVLERAATMTPETVCGVVDGAAGLLSLFDDAGEVFGVAYLNVIGCVGEAAWDAIGVLDALAKSGGFDFYLPLIAVFAERGELATLLDILHILGDDLAREVDGDAESRSVLRRLLPLLSDVLASGAVEQALALLTMLVDVPAEPGSPDSIADLTVDAIEDMVEQQSVVRTRTGPAAETSWGAQALGPFRALAARLGGEDSEAALERVFDHVAGYLTATAFEVGADGARREVLEDRTIVPLIEIVVDLAIQAIDVSDDARTCYLDAAQADLETLLTGRHVPAMVRLARVLRDDPAGASLERALARWFAPRPDAPERDVLGPLLQVFAGIIQTPLDVEGGRDLLRYASAVLDPTRLETRHFLTTLNGFLQADERGTFIDVAARLVGGRSATPPITTLSDVVGDVLSWRAPVVQDPSTGSMCRDDAPWTVADAESVTTSLASFLRDPDHGLPAIWEILRRRTRTEEP
jgi:hypothetical protein